MHTNTVHPRCIISIEEVSTNFSLENMEVTNAFTRSGAHQSTCFFASHMRLIKNFIAVCFF